LLSQLEHELPTSITQIFLVLDHAKKTQRATSSNMTCQSSALYLPFPAGALFVDEKA
jgi:hypothetical protein